MPTAKNSAKKAAAKGRRRSVKAKKKCCQDDLRCGRCPVVLMRLEKMGYAEREDKRAYEVAKVVPKKAMLVARQR